jgi:hypothetical protein
VRAGSRIGSGTWGVAGNHAVMSASTTESAGGSEMKGPADEPHGSARERASERAFALTSRTHGSAREGKRVWMGLAPTS